MNQRPEPSEYNPRYSRYMELVPETDIGDALEQQLEDTLELARGIAESMIEYRYAPDKWTTREVVGHITDTERILGYRLLSFARGDTNPLAVADEDLYVRTGEFGRIPFGELIEEFALIRKSNIALVRHLPMEAWERKGTVSGFPISVRAIAYFMVGHARHHVRMIRNIYLEQS